MTSSIATAGNDPKGLASFPTWRKSAEFVRRMDRVIDACNSYHLTCIDAQKRPSSDRNPEIKKELLEFIKWSEQWRVWNAGFYSKPPCFEGIPLMVRAIVQTYDNIKMVFPDLELTTALMNQNSVEHAHLKLRERGSFNPNPTVRGYRSIRHSFSTDCIETCNKGNATCPQIHSLVLQSSKDVNLQVEANIHNYLESPPPVDDQHIEYDSQEVQEMNEI